MPCVSNCCQQGRLRCMTPYTCRLYEDGNPVTTEGLRRVDREDQPAAVKQVPRPPLLTRIKQFLSKQPSN